MSGAAWSVVERTPEKPGPGPLPDQLLRALDLTVVRRVEGLLAGDHRAHVLGRGTELAQVRPYVAGRGRRPRHRLERHRADGGAARPRAARRARARQLDRPRHLGIDDVRHRGPAQGRRRRGRRSGTRSRRHSTWKPSRRADLRGRGAAHAPTPPGKDRPRRPAAGPPGHSGRDCRTARPPWERRCSGPARSHGSRRSSR